MKGTPLNTLPKESVDAIVRSTERIEGAASILAMLEEKADGGARDPVGDSRREVRARELRGGAGWSLVRGVKPSKAISDLDRFHFF